jgi:hypothetical protein
MSIIESFRPESIGRWTTSKGKEENRVPWRGYNELFGPGWYLDTPPKSEQGSDAPTFPSTTIDNNSLPIFHQFCHPCLPPSQSRCPSSPGFSSPACGELNTLSVSARLRASSQRDESRTPCCSSSCSSSRRNYGLTGRAATGGIRHPLTIKRVLFSMAFGKNGRNASGSSSSGRFENR